MSINWTIVTMIAAPILALFVGAGVDRLLERKARLIAYFTHSTAFNIPPAAPGQNAVVIHTHGIVLRNIGRKSATEVRVRHHVQPPHHNIFPVIAHNIAPVVGGGAEIVFPTIVPGEQVTISYLYFPPLLYNQIHAGIVHSDGSAVEVTALPVRQYPRWLLNAVRVLVFVGSVATIYVAVFVATAGAKLVRGWMGS